MPLKKIKAVMLDPALDKNQILQMQRTMLKARQERLQRLIGSIDEILKGENAMNFTVFNKTEVEGMFDAMLDTMPDKPRRIAIEEFGGVEAWKQHYTQTVSTEKMQRQYAKVMEWYGGKDAYLKTLKNPPGKALAESFKRREADIRQRLLDKRGCAPDSFEVKQIVGEYGFVMKQFLQLTEEKGMMLAMARSFREEPSRSALDAGGGEGAADFLALAIETFYQ